MNTTNNNETKEVKKDTTDWPALVYGLPFKPTLTPEQQKNIKKYNEDMYSIKFPDATDYLIRVVMIQKVLDSEKNLDYGVWVRIEEKDFMEYYKNWDSKNYKAEYKGWFISNIVKSENIVDSECLIKVNKDGNNQRPKIYPTKINGSKFTDDFYNGITKQEAQTRVDRVLGNLKNQ